MPQFGEGPFAPDDMIIQSRGQESASLWVEPTIPTPTPSVNITEQLLSTPPTNICLVLREKATVFIHLRRAPHVPQDEWKGVQINTFT